VRLPARTCPRCGHESNEDRDRFCPRCGEALPAVPRPAPQPAPSGARAGRYDRVGDADVLICPYCDHANPFAWPEELVACGGCGRRFRAPETGPSAPPTPAAAADPDAPPPPEPIPAWLVYAGIGVLALIALCVAAISR